MIQLKFLNVGCSDSIRIKYLGDDNVIHNILIDGGPENWLLYRNSLQKEIIDIISSRENIDLWIISHIDNDHIGGLLNLIKDKDLLEQLDLSKTTFWYNYSENDDYKVSTNINNLISVSQGIRLRDFLLSKSIVTDKIIEGFAMQLYGIELMVLSPSIEVYNELLNKWNNKEIEIGQAKCSKLISNTQNDYNIPIDAFDIYNYEEDNSIWNKSSIALLLKYNNKELLLSADSTSSTLISSLTRLGYSRDNKINVECMQLPHHGSRMNTSKELLDMINCSKYIICGDAINKHKLPNKETIARLLYSKEQKVVDLYFSTMNSQLSSMFSVDNLNIKSLCNINFPINNVITLNLE